MEIGLKTDFSKRKNDFLAEEGGLCLSMHGNMHPVSGFILLSFLRPVIYLCICCCRSPLRGSTVCVRRPAAPVPHHPQHGRGHEGPLRGDQHHPGGGRHQQSGGRGPGSCQGENGCCLSPQPPTLPSYTCGTLHINETTEISMMSQLMACSTRFQFLNIGVKQAYGKNSWLIELFFISFLQSFK